MQYRHRLIIPDMPSPENYLHLLREMHEAGVYSNFGPLVRRFERRLLADHGSPDETCVTSSSATAGLSAALMVAGPPLPVLVPAFTFPASLGAVRAAGREPLVVDVADATWAVNRAILQRAFASTRIGAVMLVAPFGIRPDWTAEIELCRSRGAAIIIDNASGLGGPRIRRPADDDVFEVVSMHATKPFAIGEGGAIFANRIHDAPLRSALNFGLGGQAGREPSWGFNGKMSEFHAAVGLAQADRFPEAVRLRQLFARCYRDRLATFPEIVSHENILASPCQAFPALLPSGEHVDRFAQACQEVGVEIRRYYRPSLSVWDEAQPTGPCPVAEDLSERMCVMPIRAKDVALEQEMLDLVFGALATAMRASTC